GEALSLAGADIGIINAAGNSLYVLGGNDDQVTAGNGGVLISTTATNAGLPGFTFLQYHHNASGAELFVGDQIGLTIGAATNQAPDVELDGANDGLDLPDGPNHATATPYITGNAAGVAISDTDATVDDPDPSPPTPGISAQIASLDAVLTDPHSGALEFLNVTAAGHTIATNNGLTITGEGGNNLHVAGSAADTVYQDLLKEIRYVNNDTAVALNTSDRHVTVKVNDGFADSNVPTATIGITRGNHDPEITSA